MTWRLVITPPVQAALRSFPPQTKRYVRQALLEICRDPRQGKLLRDELTGLYSFRVKRFRIVYQIQQRIVTVMVIAIGPRRTIYEALTAELRIRHS